MSGFCATACWTSADSLALPKSCSQPVAALCGMPGRALHWDGALL